MLRTYSIIRLTKLSYSIIWIMDGVTIFFFFLFFCSDHFSIGVLDRIESDSNQLTVEGTGSF